MDVARQDLRAYYEEEARLRLRKPVAGRRVELRDDFVGLLRVEGRRSVVDFGAGQGRDGEAFVAAGLDFVGLDLAHANTVLASQRGVTVVQGSIDAPPFRQGSFDAGWSMSTLMHIPTDDVPDALAAMIASLRRGAPLVVGVWGGAQGDILGEFGLSGHQRFFSLRPFDVNTRLFAACGEVERATIWDLGPEEWQYQVFQLRAGWWTPRRRWLRINRGSSRDPHGSTPMRGYGAMDVSPRNVDLRCAFCADRRSRGRRRYVREVGRIDGVPFCDNVDDGRK